MSSASTTFAAAAADKNLLPPVNPIEIKGYKFFDSVTGEELVVKGIDYYPRPNSGPLNFNSLDFYTEQHRHIWERDIPFFQELGINAIRLYAVDPSRNHDAFMCALQKAGIYVIVALAHDCPWCAITRDQAPDCYPSQLKLQGKRIIDAFSKYSNTLAFSGGNEVNHVAPPGNPGWNAPCQKKFIRDMREYIHSCSHDIHHAMRKIPVGLVVADSDRDDNTLYYNCKEGPDDEFGTAEWYGLNTYLKCSGQSVIYEYDTGLRNLAHDFMRYNYSIPVLLTEFGCLSETFPDVWKYHSQRTFLQAKWMIEEQEMRNVFSGGFAFEYSIEKANTQSGSPYPFTQFGPQSYGIGYFSPEFCNEIDTPCDYNPMPEFDFLKEAYTTSVEPYKLTKDAFEPDRTEPTECPKGMKHSNNFTWLADKTRLGACPARKPFTCPGFQPAIGVDQNPPSDTLPFLASIFAIVVFIVGSLLVIFFRQREHIHKHRPFGIAPSKNSSNSLSDESASLLSMQGLENGKTPYQSIDSDSTSSSDDDDDSVQKSTSAPPIQR